MSLRGRLKNVALKEIQEQLHSIGVRQGKGR